MKFPVLSFVLAAASFITAATYNVSNTEELRTAAERVSSGDEILLAGGNYSAEINLVGLNGITIRSQHGHRAVFDGTSPITSAWQQHSSNIYKTKLSFPIWQLFIDREQMVGARWPNAKYSDNSVFNEADNWAHCKHATTTSLKDDNLPTLSLEGAMAVLNSANFRSYARRVRGSSGNGLTFEEVGAPLKEETFRYFIDSHLSLLDSEEEWFFDPADSMLYVWGDPEGKEVHGKTQTYAITLEECSNVTVSDIDFFATAFKADKSPDLLVEKCRFTFPVTNMRMLKTPGSPEVMQVTGPRSTNFIFRDNIVEYTDGEALYVESAGPLLENNYMHTLDYTATSERGLSVTLYLRGDGVIFRNNTLHRTGSSSVMVTGNSAEFSYNDIWETGAVQNDGSVFQLTRKSVENSAAHHNWIHDTPKYAFRFDAPGNEPGAAGKNGSFHHNVVWNCRQGVMIKGNDHHIYNNTIFGSNRNDLIILDEEESNTNTMTFNNLVQKIGGHRSKASDEVTIPGTLTANINGYDSESTVKELLPHWDERNFIPEDERLIGKGRIVDKLPVSFSGDSPNIGAYEQGENWKPGTTLDTVTFSPWPWDINGTKPVSINMSAVKSSSLNSENQLWKVYNLHGQLIAETITPFGTVEALGSNQIVIMKNSVTGYSFKKIFW